MKRIGITMRQSPAQNYDEPRDALATDWYRLLAELQWQHQWLLLPNLGEETLEYALDWKIEGLILTGGDDPGTYPERDEAEYCLLKHAAIAKWPVLGVCRGMQMLQLAVGGELQVVSREQHVAHRHLLEELTLPWSKESTEIEVNSFHCNGIIELAPELQSLAWHEGCCEAMQHRQLPWTGVMWHPEREAQLTHHDRAMFNWVFGN